MLAVERRIKVLERIAADQAVEVSSLAREFGVSEMTIRRDLRRLDRDGFVRRTYGGATTRVVRSAGAALDVRPTTPLRIPLSAPSVPNLRNGIWS